MESRTPRGPKLFGLPPSPRRPWIILGVTVVILVPFVLACTIWLAPPPQAPAVPSTLKGGFGTDKESPADVMVTADMAAMDTETDGHGHGRLGVGVGVGVGGAADLKPPSNQTPSTLPTEVLIRLPLAD